MAGLGVARPGLAWLGAAWQGKELFMTSRLWHFCCDLPEIIAAIYVASVLVLACLVALCFVVPFIAVWYPAHWILTSPLRVGGERRFAADAF